jgi:hypothetical protein
MLEELLRHDKLGNREELLFFLFDTLSPEKDQALSNVRKYCTSNFFSISRTLDGIIQVLQFISFIQITGDRVAFISKNFDQCNFERECYFDQFHFYQHLFGKFKKERIFQKMFNGDNLKFNNELGQFYLLENRFPFPFFPFRNMFLSTGFLHRNGTLANHLFIKKEFSDSFKEIILHEISSSAPAGRKISLTQLKTSQEAKELAGLEAELFALEFEHQRLLGHPALNKVQIISEEYCNAGYDIESFDDKDSIVLNRYIEVKSYHGEMSFFWSKNEIEKAKELKEKYYLYLVDRSRINEKDYKPQQLQDPYLRVFESDMWKKQPDSWKVTLL